MNIIDTNVLIDYPSILRADMEIGIAWSVLEELDRIKIQTGERARKARIVSRELRQTLDSLAGLQKSESGKERETEKEKYTKEKKKEKESTTYSDIKFINMEEYKEYSVDDQLLYLCVNKGYTLITNDINLQVKCIALHVDYKAYNYNDDIYTGILRLHIPEDNDIICKVYSNEVNNLTLYENQYIIIIGEDDEVKDILVYRNGSIGPINYNNIELEYEKPITPRNIEQKCLMDALNSEATIVYAGGTYGTGKSYLLTSYALRQLQTGKINKIVYVPNNSQNENTMELGQLPGEMLPKILPYLGTLCDIVGQQQVIQMYENGELELLPMAIARGRNFENSILLINEAQNLTEEHVKLLIARCGEGTRIFFDGDIKQADANIFRQKSGLKLLTKLRFSEEFASLFSAVKLEHIERSKTAQAAAFLDELV